MTGAAGKELMATNVAMSFTMQPLAWLPERNNFLMYRQ
jgi:hypothetical protein